MGGGYFISRNKYSDFFGILLTLLPILVAKIYKKRIIFLPISFGQFANIYHEKIIYAAIKNTTIISRDKKSLFRLKMLDKVQHKLKLYYIPDLVLFYNWIKLNKHINNKYIVLTGLEWLPHNEQLAFEDEIAKIIHYIWNIYRLKTIFIPMVWNEIEDNDNNVAFRIKNQLGTNNYYQIANIKNPKEAQELLINAKFSICNRLHSAILSTTTLTPFITIAYGIKTTNFLRDFKLGEWNIEMKQLTFHNLKNKIDKLLVKKFYSKYQNQLLENRKELKIYKNNLNDILMNFINT